MEKVEYFLKKGFLTACEIEKGVMQSKEYQLREKICNGEKLTKNEKKFIEDNIFREDGTIFKYGWYISFEDVLKKFWVQDDRDGKINQVMASSLESLTAYLEASQRGATRYRIIEVTAKKTRNYFYHVVEPFMNYKAESEGKKLKRISNLTTE
jgi:hypothetical protein